MNADNTEFDDIVQSYNNEIVENLGPLVNLETQCWRIKRNICGI
jgi:hypothetical protein